MIMILRFQLFTNGGSGEELVRVVGPRVLQDIIFLGPA